MKKTFSILFLLAFCLGMQARQDTTAFYRHDVRIGWGEMFMESILFGVQPPRMWPNPEKLSPDYRVTERSNVGLTGHFFAEYQYYFMPWLSFGAQVDVECILWDRTTYDRYRKPVEAPFRERNYNLVLLPELRFTYFRNPYVRLHSGIGIGMNFAFDNMGGFALSPAFNLDLFTVQAGKGHWYGAVEIGMLNALNKDRVYILASRVISVSVGYTL